jgi:hypothetical protein
VLTGVPTVHSLVNEVVLSTREATLKQCRLSFPRATRGDVQMTTFIATVSILGAGTLAALMLSTDLGAQVALAVIAII